MKIDDFNIFPAQNAQNPQNLHVFVGLSHLSLGPLRAEGPILTTLFIHAADAIIRVPLRCHAFRRDLKTPAGASTTRTLGHQQQQQQQRQREEEEEEEEKYLEEKTKKEKT